MLKTAKTEYPIVFVHGMFGWGQNEGINRKAPYWGATTGSITEYLSGEGVECYAASVGPMSSAWDQACELYAQLTGTRVDYGEAHSKEHGHKRYGRKYEAPLFEGWSEKKKVHLIGHSFGGNSIRMLTHLLTNGAPEEKEISGENVSPLFTGGKEGLVCSVTAICSPLNGTQAYQTAEKHKLISPLKFFVYNYAGVAGRLKITKKFSDFHLEQFGLSDSPGEKDREPFAKSVRAVFTTNDCIAYDMTDSGSAIMNNRIRISPSVYYFSYSYNAVEKKGKNQKEKPVNTDFALMKATSSLMLHDNRKSGKETEGNDGLVDVDSARYPKTEPYAEFTGRSGIKAGVWNVMPTKIGDHGTPIGLMADKGRTRELYADHLLLLSDTENK